MTRSRWSLDLLSGNTSKEAGDVTPRFVRKMLIDPNKTTIWDRHDNCPREAVLKHDEDLSLETIEATGALWKNVHSLFSDKAEILGLDLPDHSHWDWLQKVRYYLPKIGFGFVTLECEKIVQGLMLCNNVARSPVTKNERGEFISTIYIEYLESAPWNLKAYTKTPRFAYVGTRLLAFAALNATMISGDGRKRGIECRVGLHSLPNAVPFYQKHGFEYFGPDLSREDQLPYMELPDEKARLLVQRSMKVVEG